MAIFIIHGFEAFLSFRGYSPWVSDSKALWGMHRERVKWTSNPIVLAGASRIQLNFSVEKLSHLLNRKVIQLAIDGQRSLPLLEHFANDDSFKGTLIISLQEQELFTAPIVSETTKLWLANYKQRHSGTIAPNIEALLQAYFQTLYSYHSIEMDSATLMRRLLSGAPGSSYLKTAINRDRFADYRKVPFPGFYAGRVIRHLGYSPQLPSPLTLDGFTKLIQKEIKNIKKYEEDLLARNQAYIKELVDKISERGSTVIIMRMPTDKLILGIDDARSSHVELWSKMKKMGIKSLHFSELPDIDKFYLPDGSHMDQSQKQAFTKNVVTALTQRGWL